mmetsp:Transcript_108043/g.271804  ORF Transcript_108043/g.271804 Transcript_108043/m.271804 type:complete len:356 (+) Transcript_108043:941-2008(+)
MIKPLSPRSDSDAPVRAAQCAAMASRTNSRSARSSGAASPKANPEYFVASKTTFLSARSSGAAYCNAAPWLAMSAPNIKSLSAWTSTGAMANCFQSISTAARQVACRQLLGSITGVPASVLVASKQPCFSAATAEACRVTANAAMSALGSSWTALPAALSSRAMASSSCRGKSFERLKSFRNLSADLSLKRIAALTLVKKKRPAMSNKLLAKFKSKSKLLSTSTNFASHREAPHCARSSLGSGVTISPEGVSLWCFKYSITFATVFFFSGTGISLSIPVLRAILRTPAEMHAASAGTWNTAPSFDLSVIVLPCNSGGHASMLEKRKRPKTSYNSPILLPARHRYFVSRVIMMGCA